MTVLSSLDFDSYSEDADISPSSPWDAAAGGAKFVAAAAAAHDGAMGARMSDTSSYGTIEWTPSGTTAVVLSAWFNWRTFSTAKQYCGNVLVGTSPVADWRVNGSTHTVAIRDNAVAKATSTAALTAGTWYRCDWKIDPGGATQELRIFAEGGTSALIDLSGSYSGGVYTVLAVGNGTAAAGGALDMDTLQVLDDWPDPPGGTTPTTGFYYYDGTQWVRTVPNYYDGTQWIECDVVS